MIAKFAEPYIVELVLGLGAFVLAAMQRNNAQQVKRLSERVESLEEAKDELHEQIRTQAEDIGHLTSERDSLRREVRALKARIVDLETNDHRPQEGLG